MNFNLCYITLLIAPGILAGVIYKGNRPPLMTSDDVKNIGENQPQQIHLALGDQENEIVVTWVTTKETNNPVVNYGPVDEGFTYTNEGLSTKFQDGGELQRTMFIHRVHLKDLNYDTQYIYRCGSNDGWSSLYFFKTLKNGTDWPLSLAVYGDLGLENPQSLSRLQTETESGMYDAIIHVGDFAYNMDDENAEVGDAFMNNIQPISAYVPYMVCPGNHEQNYNFSNYRARFSMPNYEQTESMFYAWNAGRVHFISINTEAYYFLNYGIKPLYNLHKWLLQDLKEATTPEARSKRPWIILYGHRPMYCSNNDQDDCTFDDCVLRVGIPFLGFKWFGLEKYLSEFGVDLAIWAHEHSYERLWPIYDYQVLNGTNAKNPYDNPRGPVHIITGSAGCKERKDLFNDLPSWSAFRSNDYGYSRLTILNDTHLHWQQVSDDQDGKIIDDIWIVRDNHESYQNVTSKLEGRNKI